MFLVENIKKNWTSPLNYKWLPKYQVQVAKFLAQKTISSVAL